eukprot:7301452-Karenia_brevis.AAC.1
MSSHVGQSGYATSSQSTMGVSSMMPNRARILTTPSESVASSDSWSRVDFLNSPIKTERDLEINVEEIDKMEKETGKVGENALNIMLTQIYHQIWK